MPKIILKNKAFYLILDGEYEPSYLAELNRLFVKQKAAIDELSVYLRNECKNDEQKASKAKNLTIIGYVVFCLIVFVAIVIFVNNISKAVIKEINEKQEAQKKLETINKDKDRLLSILAHDIKNSLNSIIGFSGILENDAKSKGDKELEETASHIL